MRALTWSSINTKPKDHYQQTGSLSDVNLVRETEELDERPLAGWKAEPAWSRSRPGLATEANLQTFISSNLSGCRGRARVHGTRGVARRKKAK